MFSQTKEIKGDTAWYKRNIELQKTLDLKNYIISKKQIADWEGLDDLCLDFETNVKKCQSIVFVFY